MQTFGPVMILTHGQLSGPYQHLWEKTIMLQRSHSDFRHHILHDRSHFHLIHLTSDSKFVDSLTAISLEILEFGFGISIFKTKVLRCPCPERHIDPVGNSITPLTRWN